MANDNPNPAPNPSPAPSSTLSAPPQIIIQPQATMFGRFGKWLLAALVIAIFVILGLVGSYRSYFNTSEGIQEKYHSLSKYANKKIAIIDISGAILGGQGFVKKQIDRAHADDSVVAVVLRINSPGGTITGSDYLYHHLRELATERELPLVVSMGGVCASGGYYIAMAVGDRPDVIFAEPTTWTGSIGVIIPHYDLTGLMTMLSIKNDSVVSGPFKELGSPTRPMTEEDRKLLQELVDESFARFKDIVVSGRPTFKGAPAKLDAVATGQVFAAKQALDEGLVDKIGFIEDAIQRAAELAGYDEHDVRCVEYEQPPALFSQLIGVHAPPLADGDELATWLDLATPRAYYLWTWLPPILTNTRP